MAITNPSFEDGVTGGNPGEADGWTVSQWPAAATFVFSRAGYQRHDTDANYWSAEYFDGGWDNDDGFLDSLAETGVVYYVIEGEDYESFDIDWEMAGWPTIEIPMAFNTGFTDADLTEAVYQTEGGSGTEEFEAFETGWSNELRPDGDEIFTWVPWIDGAAPTWEDPLTGLMSFVINESFTNIHLKLDTGSDPFDTDVALTAGTYTAADLAAEMQSKIGDALDAKGGFYQAADITVTVNPAGGIRITDTKVPINGAFFMTLSDPVTGSAWSSIGFTLDGTDAMPRGKEFDTLTEASYAPATEKFEAFEDDWNNAIDEVMWTWVPWVDGYVEDTTTFDIVVNTNDTLKIMIDDFAGSDDELDVTLAAGSYTLAQMITEFETKLNTALTGAGWAAGDIDIFQSPDGQIRVQNNSAINNGRMWFGPGVTDAWPTLGFIVGSEFSGYDRHTIRTDEGNTITEALYDSAVNPHENFEGTWSALP